MKKNYILFLSLLVLGLFGKSNAASVKTITDDFGSYMATCMSENGKWIAGSGFLWNVESGEVIELLDEAGEPAMVNAVMNDGTVVGDGVKKLDGEWDMLGQENPDDFGVWGTTPDGSVLVGYVGGWDYKPCAWRNGELIMLPIPTSEVDVLAGLLDDHGRALYVSNDGNVILGDITQGQNLSALWIWNGTEYVGDFIEREKLEADEIWNMLPGGVSANGKWISCTKKDAGWESLYEAYRYNVETKEVQIASLPDVGFEAAGIADDGTLVGYTDAFMIGRVGYIWAAGSDALQLLSECSGLKIVEEYDAMNNSPLVISADGRKIVGFGMRAVGEEAVTESYLIDLDGEGAVEKVSDGKAPKLFSVAGNEVVALSKLDKLTVFAVSGKVVFEVADVEGAVALDMEKGVYVVKAVVGNQAAVAKVVVK